MRILFITNLYPPLILGGYEIACAQTAEAMRCRGHEVQVLTAWNHVPQESKTPDWVHRRLDLHWYFPHVPNKTLEARELHSAVCSSYSNTMHLLDALSTFRPDVVSAWNLMGIGGLAMMDLLNHVGVPWTLYLGDRLPVDIAANVPGDVKGIFNAANGEVYDKARIFSVSQNLLDEIERESDISFPQGADIVAGWADLSQSLPHEPYLQGGKARFVAASSIGHHKGTDLIIEASAQLQASGVDFLVDIFGDGDLPPYVDMVKQLGVEGRVRFLGSLPYMDLLRAYSGYDAFLCPTWERDPFPFAPLGAAGCFTPPILTRNCGTSERLVDGVHCIKIERTSEELAGAMADVASGRVDLAKMGRAGRRLVENDLSFERHLNRMERAFEESACAWDMPTDPLLPLLLFLKHNLSVRLRFG